MSDAVEKWRAEKARVRSEYAEELIRAGDAVVEENERLRGEVARLAERYGHLWGNPCRQCGNMSEDAEQPPMPTGACGGGGELGSRWVCGPCRSLTKQAAAFSTLSEEMARRLAERDKRLKDHMDAWLWVEYAMEPRGSAELAIAHTGAEAPPEGSFAWNVCEALKAKKGGE